MKSSRLLGVLFVALVTGQITRADEFKTSGKIGEDFTNGGYELVWADEFNENGAPNQKNWVCAESWLVSVGRRNGS